MNKTDAEIVSVDGNGTPIERPDLDVRFGDGSDVGLEIAKVSNIKVAKHGSNRHLIEMTIRGLIDFDEQFAQEFGDFYISFDLHGLDIYERAPLEKKREALAIAAEITDYVWSGQHKVAHQDRYTPAPKALKALSQRGSMFFISPMESAPNFSMSDEAGTIGRTPQEIEVVQMFEKHRRSAATYRPGTLRLFLLITDAHEMYYDMLTALAARRLKFCPSKACMWPIPVDDF